MDPNNRSLLAARNKKKHTYTESTINNCARSGTQKMGFGGLMGKRFMESWSRHFFIFGQIFGIVADNKDASKLSSNMDKIRQNMKKKPDLTCLLNLFSLWHF